MQNVMVSCLLFVWHLCCVKVKHWRTLSLDRNMERRGFWSINTNGHKLSPFFALLSLKLNHLPHATSHSAYGPLSSPVRFRSGIMKFKVLCQTAFMWLKWYFRDLLRLFKGWGKFKSLHLVWINRTTFVCSPGHHVTTPLSDSKGKEDAGSSHLQRDPWHWW